MSYRTIPLIFCRSVFALSLLNLSACASQTVKFIHPQTGATAECSASGFGIGATLTDGYVSGCGRAYEERGYLRADQLTREQRTNLEQRGLMPKE
jgi:hypothetical protein